MLTDDAMAVRFAVPNDVAPSFRFEHGQYLTLREVIDGETLRRSYSICSAVGDTDLTIAVKRIDGGRFSEHVHRNFKRGMTVDVAPPAGEFTTPLAARARAQLSVHCGRQRHHADSVDRPYRARARTAQPGHVVVRQPAHRNDDVPRRAVFPEKRVSRSAAVDQRDEPRTAGSRGAQRSHQQPQRRRTEPAPDPHSRVRSVLPVRTGSDDLRSVARAAHAKASTKRASTTSCFTPRRRTRKR